MNVHTNPSVDRRLAVQIGAGLSLALAGFLLFASGNWFSLLLVPLGALTGLAVRELLARHPALYENALSIKASAVGGGTALMRPLADERLMVRFPLLLLLTTLLFLATWGLAYTFLPEGLVASGSEVRMMGQAEVASTFADELLFIVVRNLPWVVGIALVNLLFGYGFACLIPVNWAIFYGLILGTNSFAVPLPAPLPPSLTVLDRAGPYEMAAFLFAAAATFPLSRISLPWRKVETTNRVSWSVILLGLILSATGVFLAAWREAAMLFGS